ncbi:MAG: hypothetical protein FWB72_06340 [Firmicutes bacterium]|nr:hypothetical protein [Bacillota bacterium]
MPERLILPSSGCEINDKQMQNVSGGTPKILLIPIIAPLIFPTAKTTKVVAAPIAAPALAPTLAPVVSRATEVFHKNVVTINGILESNGRAMQLHIDSAKMALRRLPMESEQFQHMWNAVQGFFLRN